LLQLTGQRGPGIPIDWRRAELRATIARNHLCLQQMQQYWVLSRGALGTDRNIRVYKLLIHKHLHPCSGLAALTKFEGAPKLASQNGRRLENLKSALFRNENGVENRGVTTLAERPGRQTPHGSRQRRRLCRGQNAQGQSPKFFYRIFLYW
jgi:hypothetical protein